MPRSLANSGCDKSVLSQSETSRLHRSLVSSFTLVLLRNRGGSPRQIIGARRPSSAGYVLLPSRAPPPWLSAEREAEAGCPRLPRSSALMLSLKGRKAPPRNGARHSTAAGLSSRSALRRE